VLESIQHSLNAGPSFHILLGSNGFPSVFRRDLPTVLADGFQGCSDI